MAMVELSDSPPSRSSSSMDVDTVKLECNEDIDFLPNSTTTSPTIDTEQSVPHEIKRENAEQEQTLDANVSLPSCSSSIDPTKADQKELNSNNPQETSKVVFPLKCEEQDSIQLVSNERPSTSSGPVSTPQLQKAHQLSDTSDCNVHESLSSKSIESIQVEPLLTHLKRDPDDSSNMSSSSVGSSVSQKVKSLVNEQLLPAVEKQALSSTTSCLNRVSALASQSTSCNNSSVGDLEDYEMLLDSDEDEDDEEEEDDLEDDDDQPPLSAAFSPAKLTIIKNKYAKSPTKSKKGKLFKQEAASSTAALAVAASANAAFNESFDMDLLDEINFGGAGVGSASPSALAAGRQEKSLGLLTSRFVNLLQDAKNGVLHLKLVSLDLVLFSSFTLPLFQGG